MTPATPTVSDPRAIRALAHPTRLALLEILAVDDEATATRCAELSGQSVASCSFHLRTLARHGFIEAVPARGKQKPWRLTSLRQEIAHDRDAETDAAGAAFDEFFLGHEFARLRAWMHRRGQIDDDSDAWRRASLMAGATAWLTVDELAQIRDEVDALIERRFVDRMREGGGRRTADRKPVRLFVASSVGLYNRETD